MRRRLAIGLLALLPVGLLASRALPLPRRNLPASAAQSSAAPMMEAHRTPSGPRQRGVALGLFAEDVSFSYAPLLDEIVALGASHVALVVPLYQVNAVSTKLGLHTRFSPTLETLADTIRCANRAGLEVTVFPIVRLSNPRQPGEWRGTLAPSNRDAWFASYTEQLGDLASIAMLTGATRLVVGSELSSLDGDLERWGKLVTLIRAVFSGTLVYSANWDHYQDARLFDLVDEMGVVGYFNLRESSGPSDVHTLAARWWTIAREIEASLAKYGKPFVFTEVGYRSRRGATAAPWDEASGGIADAAEQQRGFEAFRLAWTAPATSHARLDGIYIWNWYGFGGPQTTSYTPRGKPAVATIKQIMLDLEGP
jgi:hypothetical protein